MTATLARTQSVTAVASRQPAQSTREAKLNALTALRFFAASMIFIGHTTALAPPNRPNYTEGFALWQGVSFFFVLSGFILAYVYPNLKSPAEAGRFLLARFARIWPTHLVAFVVTLLLVPQCMQVSNAIAAAVTNLCMVQVWTLNETLAASFNKVSWTISVELFFYVCFPFLIKDFTSPFKARWICLGALALSFGLLCTIPFFPNCAGYNFPEAVFIGFNPLSRLAEFILGLAICRAFMKKTIFSELKPVPATGLEICSLALVAAAICLPKLWPIESTSGLTYVLRSWALDMGGAPAYGALIYLMANERGYISKFLTKKLFVWLGEISFSLYMFHLSIIFFLIKFQPSFSNQPDWVFPLVAFAICLCVSHLNYKLIETPCRRAIMAIGAKKKKNNSDVSLPSIKVAANTSAKVSTPGSFMKSLMVTTAEITLTCLLVAWVQVHYRFIPPAFASRIEAHSIPVMRGIDFGDKFKLRAFKLTHQNGGIQINSVWQSLATEKLDYINAVQLLDSKGRVKSSQDYLQDTFQRKVAAGQIWEDKLFINKEQLKGVTTIGIELFKQSEQRPLVAASSRTDWDGRRLLIPLE
jgi:peptidoglycan/LPS O-acetylase OafA/YrhL